MCQALGTLPQPPASKQPRKHLEMILRNSGLPYHLYATPSFAHTCVHICTCTHTHTRALTLFAYISVRVHMCTHLHIHTSTNACMPVHTSIHGHLHTSQILGFVQLMCACRGAYCTDRNMWPVCLVVLLKVEQRGLSWVFLKPGL